MKTKQNANKTAQNNLTLFPIFSGITSPLILSVLVAGLLILTACSAAAPIAPARTTSAEIEDL
ncbi:MAG: hypothetical protein K8953_02715, partial [Proteobacteria bacterium]|nr:hypothetical protein [Pseudomonadota bacterium]